MSVAVRKVPGVMSAKVTLNEGKVSIQLRPGNAVSMDEIRKAITHQGFTPKEAAVEVIGQIRRLNGELQFAVTNSKDVYKLSPTPHANWNQRVGKEITVRALIPVPQGGKLAEIQITELERQTPTSAKN